jgi:WhiB family transcriptional regulator, redox-sensing transcriptional regulator
MAEPAVGVGRVRVVGVGRVRGGPSRQPWVSRRQAAGENWQVIAACQLVDPELFFPISAAGKSLEQIAEAKKVCARCPVQPECLTFAQRTGQAHGIWGGLTEEERIQVARSRQPGAPPVPTAPWQLGSRRHEWTGGAATRAAGTGG